MFKRLYLECIIAHNSEPSVFWWRSAIWSHIIKSCPTPIVIQCASVRPFPLKCAFCRIPVRHAGSCAAVRCLKSDRLCERCFHGPYNQIRVKFPIGQSFGENHQPQKWLKMIDVIWTTANVVGPATALLIQPRCSPQCFASRPLFEGEPWCTRRLIVSRVSMDRDNQRPHGILTYDKTGI